MASEGTAVWLVTSGAAEVHRCGTVGVARQRGRVVIFHYDSPDQADYQRALELARRHGADLDADVWPDSLADVDHELTVWTYPLTLTHLAD